MAPRIPTIDSRVHAYERDRPERPWHGTLAGPDEVTGDDVVAAMDAVGVDGALLVSPYAMYRYDAGYAIEVHDKHPYRFGLIRPFDPQSEAIDNSNDSGETTSSNRASVIPCLLSIEDNLLSTLSSRFSSLSNRFLNGFTMIVTSVTTTPKAAAIAVIHSGATRLNSTPATKLRFTRLQTCGQLRPRPSSAALDNVEREQDNMAVLTHFSTHSPHNLRWLIQHSTTKVNRLTRAVRDPSGFVDFRGGAVQDQGVEVDAARFVASAGEVPGGGAVQDGEGAPEQGAVAQRAKHRLVEQRRRVVLVNGAVVEVEQNTVAVAGLRDHLQHLGHVVGMVDHDSP